MAKSSLRDSDCSRHPCFQDLSLPICNMQVMIPPIAQVIGRTQEIKPHNPPSKSARIVESAHSAVIMVFFAGCSKASQDENLLPPLFTLYLRCLLAHNRNLYRWEQSDLHQAHQARIAFPTSGGGTTLSSCHQQPERGRISRKPRWGLGFGGLSQTLGVLSRQ